MSFTHPEIQHAEATGRGSDFHYSRDDEEAEIRKEAPSTFLKIAELAYQSGKEFTVHDLVRDTATDLAAEHDEFLSEQDIEDIVRECVVFEDFEPVEHTFTIHVSIQAPKFATEDITEQVLTAYNVWASDGLPVTIGTPDGTEMTIHTRHDHG